MAYIKGVLDWLTKNVLCYKLTSSILIKDGIVGISLVDDHYEFSDLDFNL